MGSVLETVLITQGCFSYRAGLAQPGLFCSSLLQQEEFTRSWGGTQWGQLSTADPRDIPDHNVKPGKEEEVGDVRSDDNCVPKSLLP